MGDIVERLINISRGDHERGCNGRSYTCSCGYDDVNEKTADQAAAEITRLRAEVERLTRDLEATEELRAQATVKCADLTEAIYTASAEAFERAAQIAEEYIGMGWRGSELPSAIRQAASGESGGET